ncbi:MAG TPA: GNAT family N-acetyltransferase [Xanthobacteraceae bacterium]|nr:GNAT family N-acetyltransferase [Xanthobacteraceae bacterium]
MSQPLFVIEALAPNHDRSSFTCGVEPLDRYLRQQATQDMRRRIANCFVLIEKATGTVAGYYTLSGTSLFLTDLPHALAKRLPRYPLVPAALLGRLAIATAYQSRHLGASLLADAAERASRADLAVFAVVAAPKDDRARRFYVKYGFTELPGAQSRLFVPIDAILQFFEAQNKS